MDPRERRLIRRLKQRDEAAFREMVQTHQQQVYNLIFRMLGNREEAEDLAQEVFVTVFKSIDSFRGESRFSTWLYRVTVNHCHNRFKYLARRQFHDAQPLEAADRKGAHLGPGARVSLHAEISEPDKVLAGKELERVIQREIEALDEEHRLMIVLRDIQGLTYQEITTITQLAEGTIKSRLHRARMALKERLDKYLKV
jgi:RNA polymerase sigma-70 factor (ECF subfamily)